MRGKIVMVVAESSEIADSANACTPAPPQQGTLRPGHSTLRLTDAAVGFGVPGHRPHLMACLQQCRTKSLAREPWAPVTNTRMTALLPTVGCAAQ